MVLLICELNYSVELKVYCNPSSHSDQNYWHFCWKKCIPGQFWVSESEASSVVNMSSCCCALYRWAWSSAEEDLHQMGELSLRPSDLSNRRLVHGPTRWPHAYPPSGSALRRTAGQYHTATPHTIQNLTLALSMTQNMQVRRKENSCSISPLISKFPFPSYCLCWVNLNDLMGVFFPLLIHFSQPRPTKGRMRIHCLENVDKALQFLKEQKVHLENMGSHDIVDGNHRLTLGLIWTIILRFQVTSLISCLLVTLSWCFSSVRFSTFGLSSLCMNCACP